MTQCCLEVCRATGPICPRMRNAERQPSPVLGLSVSLLVSGRCRGAENDVCEVMKSNWRGGMIDRSAGVCSVCVCVCPWRQVSVLSSLTWPPERERWFRQPGERTRTCPCASPYTSSWGLSSPTHKMERSDVSEHARICGLGGASISHRRLSKCLMRTSLRKERKNLIHCWLWDEMCVCQADSY